jgi:uncharacterized delta-60 repeat protein
MLRRFLIAAAAVSVIAPVIPASAAAGALDDGFGTSGVAVDTRDWWFSDVAMQSDGKIVVSVANSWWENNRFTGHGHVARFTAAGAPDAMFSGDGLARYSGLDEADAVAVQANGKIVVAGSTHRSGADYDMGSVTVGRFNAGGGLDLRFSGDGRTSTRGPAGYTDVWAGDVAVQSDGKIVVLATGYSATRAALVVYRYNPNGSLDLSFSTDGKAVVTAPNNVAYVYADELTVRPSGKIVVTGSTEKSGLVIARLRANGALDTTFSGDGKVMTNVGLAPLIAAADGLAVQGDGKIVVTGYAENADVSPNDEMFVARFLPSGSRDTGFGGGDGVVVQQMPNGTGAYDVNLLADGKIVAVGESYSSTGVSSATVVKLLSSGVLDADFGTGGVAVAATGMLVWRSVLQADGKLVLAGSQGWNAGMLARFLMS